MYSNRTFNDIIYHKYICPLNKFLKKRTKTILGVKRAGCKIKRGGGGGGRPSAYDGI